MADSKEKIYRIKFEGTAEQTSNLVALKNAIEGVKKEQDALNLKKGQTTEQNEKLIIQLKDLNKQYQAQQTEIAKTAKANQEGADTLEKMRARLALMHKEYEKTPVGTEAMNKQAQAMKILQLEINKADEATGRYNGNVGNYTNSIKAALSALRDKEIVMKKELLLLTEGTKEYEKQSKAIIKLESDIKETEQAGEDFTKGTEKAKGLVVGAFQSMGINITAVQETINGAKLAILGMEAATTKSAMAMKVLKIALASTGIGLIVIALGSLIAYLTSTQAGIDKVNKVLEPLKTIFQRIVGIVQEFGKGLAMLFSGDFKGGMEQLGTTISNVGTNLKKAADDGSRLAQITVEIELARIKLAENEARLTREMEEQRMLLSNAAASDKERIEAGEKYKKLSNEKLELEKGIAKLEYEQAFIKSEQNDTDREAQAELARKKEAINALEAATMKEQRRVINTLNSIQAKAADDRIKAIDTEKTKLLEFAKLSEQLNKMIFAQTDKYFADLESKIKTANEAMGVNFEITPEEITDTETDRLLKEVEDKKAIQADWWQFSMAGINEMNEAGKITNVEAKQRETDLWAFRGKMAGDAAQLFKKNTAAAKILLSAEAAMNTYVGMARALKDYPAPYSFIMAAITGAFGLTQVAQINNVKFAKGGIVGGNTHENGGTIYRGSDGQVFEAERGELITVVNRHDTERLRMLSAANSMHGRAFFASGGVMTPTSDFSDRKMRAIIQETVNSISSIPVVVSERDISKSQRRVSVIDNAGNL